MMMIERNVDKGVEILRIMSEINKTDFHVQEEEMR